MSIYIPDMEMPTTCFECPFMFARRYCRADLTLDLYQGDYEELKGRVDGCPLVPVPPHGRLIAEDAIRQSIKESIDECYKWSNEVEGGEMYTRVSQTLATFVECQLRLRAAPTIIPAEEGEG